MSYDADLRRDTPLARRLKAAIAARGPLAVSEYTKLCLADPEYGYYRSRPALGAAGDFITAPEISQVFGELIGLWAVVVWQQMGRPDAVNVIEIGPGRGTLMLDALRAARSAPAFLAAAAVHLIEVEGPMRQVQRERLTDAHPRIDWHDRLEQVPVGPSILIANEYVDTLPIEQSVASDGCWLMRAINLGADGELCFTTEGRNDGIREQRRGVDELAAELSRRARVASVAGLFIDYGHVEPRLGDTLQAVRGHAYEHPLTSPGEADLTTQVDFADLAARFRAVGLAVDGPTTQLEFLGRLGAAERASRLMSARPAKAAQIEAGVHRLLAPGGMGTRFKALCARSDTLPAAPAFA